MGGAVDAQSPLDHGRGARMVLWLRSAPPPGGHEDPPDAASAAVPLTPALPLHPPV
jgi:hypothetical protein